MAVSWLISKGLWLPPDELAQRPRTSRPPHDKSFPHLRRQLCSRLLQETRLHQGDFVPSRKMGRVYQGLRRRDDHAVHDGTQGQVHGRASDVGGSEGCEPICSWECLRADQGHRRFWRRSGRSRRVMLSDLGYRFLKIVNRGKRLDWPKRMCRV